MVRLCQLQACFALTFFVNKQYICIVAPQCSILAGQPSHLHTSREDVQQKLVEELLEHFETGVPSININAEL